MDRKSAKKSNIIQLLEDKSLLKTGKYEVCFDMLFALAIVLVSLVCMQMIPAIYSTIVMLYYASALLFSGVSNFAQVSSQRLKRKEMNSCSYRATVIGFFIALFTHVIACLFCFVLIPVSSMFMVIND